MDPIQIAIVVVIMVVGAVRWVIENVVNKGKSNPDQSAGDTLEDLYEEARREIHDRQARRSPEGETAPSSRPPVLPPNRTASPPPMPAARSRPTPTPPQVERYQPLMVHKPTFSAAEKAALARAQEREKTSRPPRPGSQAPTTVRGLLSSPQAARKAILLKEILGPPKSALE
jgi:hypothetical protein